MTDSPTLRPVPDHDGVYADFEGQIWRTEDDGSVVLCPGRTRKADQYLIVSVRLGDKRVLAYVHRLVAKAWHGLPPSPIAVTRHLDGDARNNRPNNLAWGSPTENAADRARHGRTMSGERNPRAKLTEKDVYAIRVAHHLGISRKVLCEYFGVGKANILRIVNGLIWAQVGGPLCDSST